MTNAERVEEIKSLLEDNWFWDNPNTSDVNAEVQFLLDRVQKLEGLIEKADRVIIEKNWWNAVKKEAGL